MILHSFKLIWNQKRKNAYIILELFFLFVVLLISSVYLIEKYELYTGGVGANIDDTFYMRLITKDFSKGDYKARLMDMQKEIESLPDVKMISYSRSAIPYIWSMSMSGMTYDSNNVVTVIREVDEQFDDVFEIEVLAGQWLENDWQGANTPIVIDIQAAESLFGDKENALGKIVSLDGENKVVGVYRMLKRNEYEENYPSCFLPANFTDMYAMDIVVKYKEGKIPNSSQLSKIVFSYFDKNIFDIRYASTMAAKKQNILAETHVEIVMFSFLAVFLIVNIILGMIGIFGYSVKRRKGEIGVRRALGSSSHKVQYLLLLESWTLTLMALVPAIFLTVQIPILQLYPIETDLFIKAMALSIGLIFTLVSISVYYPGLLASRIQAAQALQEE
jgi:putative ABC transport system permease protein